MKNHLLLLLALVMSVTAAVSPGAPPTKSAAKEERITINVFGAVKKPGAAKLVVPVTILDALGAAGGYHSRADLTQVVVLRGAAGEKPEKIVVNVSAILKGDAPNVALQHRDAVTVVERAP